MKQDLIDAAPLLGDERPAYTKVSWRSRRLRRRGPRSFDALHKRSLRLNRIGPTGEDPGESRTILSPSSLHLQPLNIYICNIRCILNNLAELVKTVEDNNIHHVLCQESYLGLTFL